MTRNCLRKGSVISVIGAIAIVVLPVSVGSVAHAEQELWGAIAISADGQHIGVSKNMPNETAANNAANFNCQQDNPTCNVMLSFHYPECGAIAKTEDQYYRDLGIGLHDAEQNALRQSPKRTTKLLRSLCNDPPSDK
jgi:Domain of unknown function (DUF4189)